MAVLVMAEREAFTLLGWHVRELMGRKRVRNQDDLAERISVAGYPISQPAVSKILRGKSEPSRGFISTLAVALDLTAEERRELADVFAYDEASVSEPVTEENMRGMEEVRNRVREEDGRHREDARDEIPDHRA